MAATVDNRPTSSKAALTEYGKSYQLVADVNFVTTANQLAQNETMALFDLPINTLIEYAGIQVVTADTDVSDVDLGVSATGATDATLIDGATLATAGWKQDATPDPVVTSAATQVTLTNKDADTINEAVIKVVLICRALL